MKTKVRMLVARAKIF